MAERGRVAMGEDAEKELVDLAEAVSKALACLSLLRLATVQLRTTAEAVSKALACLREVSRG